MRFQVVRSFVSRRFASFVVLGLVVVVVPSPVSATVFLNSVDAPVDGGSVTIIEPESTSNPMVSGDSNSAFQLVLPEGASCPGDSFHENWRVNSFIIPATDDPGSLRYGIISPDGEGRRSLYTVTTRPFIHMVLGKSDGAGEPGPIVQPEPMTFAVYPAGQFPPGNYRIGLACTEFRETAVFWDAEITLTEASNVQPGGFVWSLVEDSLSGAPGQSNSGGSASWFPLVAGLLVVVGGVAMLRRRPSASRHSIPQEQK